MKKILSIILCSVLIMGLCSCGGSDYKIVCTSLTPPFNYQTKSGDRDGIDQAILTELSKRLEFKYELEYDNDTQNALDSVRGEKYDAILGGLTKNANTEEKLDFSESYYTDGFAIVALESNDEITSLESLKDKTVAVANNSNCYFYFNEKAAEMGFELITFKSTADFYSELPAGTIDAYIDNLSSVNYLLDSGAPMKVIYSEENTFEYTFGFPKGKNEQLRLDIDKAIKEMKSDGTLEEILNKYKTIVL